MFINISPSTHMFTFHSRLILIGSRGKFILKSFGNYSYNYKLILSRNKIFIKNTKTNNYLTVNVINLFKIFNELKLKIWCCNNLYEQIISLFGTGFRLWVKNLKNMNILLLRVGLSEDIFIKIPNCLVVLPIRANLVRIIGLEKLAVSEFSALLKNQIKKDVYKGKGLHYGLDNKSAILKVGKKK